MRRSAVRAAVCGAVLVAGVVIPATTANASIGYCYGYYSVGERWDAYCYGSYPSSYRAIATCYSYNTGQGHNRYGAWKTAGGSGSSIVVCLTGEYIANGTWQTAA